MSNAQSSADQTGKVVPINRYDAVIAVFPASLPAVSRRQAAVVYAAIKRRFGLGNITRADDLLKRRGAIRRCWLSKAPTSPHANTGLARLVHDVSHRLFEAVYPQRRPHDPLHVTYEADVAAFVVDHLDAWFKPAPIKAAPSLSEKRARDLVKIEAAIGRWESKQRRAKTALKKLAAKRHRLVKLLSGDSK